MWRVKVPSLVDLGLPGTRGRRLETRRGAVVGEPYDRHWLGSDVSLNVLDSFTVFRRRWGHTKPPLTASVGSLCDSGRGLTRSLE